MTHTEKAHVILGLLAALAGALGLWGTYRPASPARPAWPVMTFLIGLVLFLPVEAQTRTYQEVGWWETLGSVVPQHPGSWIRDWFQYLGHWHVVQHKVGSFLMMVAGVIEFQRGRGRLAGGAYGLVFPSLMLGVGLAFGVHGGSSEHLPNRTEQVHHHLLGAALGIAALSLALVRAGRLRHRAWQGVWAALVLAIGIDIGLFYRLTPADRAPAAHHHEAAEHGAP